MERALFKHLNLIFLLFQESIAGRNGARVDTKNNHTPKLDKDLHFFEKNHNLRERSLLDFIYGGSNDN